MEHRDLTPEEQAAIRALQRLAKKWPKTLWLFCGSGSMSVLLLGEDGQPVMDGTSFAHSHIVASVTGIRNDGGDW